MLLYAVVMDVLLPDHNATVRKEGAREGGWVNVCAKGRSI
jgi:hypothetical protein